MMAALRRETPYDVRWQVDSMVAPRPTATHSDRITDGPAATYGWVVQLVERRSHKADVSGSIPLSATNHPLPPLARR